MIPSLTLNSIPASVFEYSKDGSETSARVERNALIAMGRYVVKEYNAIETNRVSRNAHAVEHELSDADYRKVAKQHKEDLLMFCTGRAYAQQGKAAPSVFSEVSNDLSLSKDRTFLATLSGITKEVIAPVLPYVISNAAGMMMNWTTIPMGQTRDITVHSNDIFLFEESAPGAGRSATANQLHQATITLNPRAHSCRAQIPFYRLVANDIDIGWYYNAIITGLYGHIMGKFTKQLTTAIADTKYVPSYLQFSTYSSANYASALVKVTEANHLQRNQCMVLGDYRALSKVLPSGTAADAALTYGLGKEWTGNGFLATVGGVPLYEIQNVMVPGTVNTTGEDVFPDDKLFIIGRPADGYAPMYGAFAEGSPLTIEMNPTEGTADFSIWIDVTAMYDIQPVFASKIGVITNV